VTHPVASFPDHEATLSSKRGALPSGSKEEDIEGELSKETRVTKEIPNTRPIVSGIGGARDAIPAQPSSRRPTAAKIEHVQDVFSLACKLPEIDIFLQMFIDQIASLYIDCGAHWPLLARIYNFVGILSHTVISRFAFVCCNSKPVLRHVLGKVLLPFDVLGEAMPALHRYCGLGRRHVADLPGRVQKKYPDLVLQCRSPASGSPDNQTQSARAQGNGVDVFNQGVAPRIVRFAVDGDVRGLVEGLAKEADIYTGRYVTFPKNLALRHVRSPTRHR
jgi:hypothetical protein